MGQKLGIEERKVQALEEIARALRTLVAPEKERIRDERIGKLSQEAGRWRLKYRQAQAEIEALRANGQGGRTR